MVATDRASPRDVGWASMGRTIRRTALFAARPVARRVMTGVLVGLPLPIESALRGAERARKGAKQCVMARSSECDNPRSSAISPVQESRVLDWGSRGRRFESGQPDQRNPCSGGGFSRFRVELDHGAGAGVEQTWSIFAQKEAVPRPIWLVRWVDLWNRPLRVATGPVRVQYPRETSGGDLLRRRGLQRRPHPDPRKGGRRCPTWSK